MFAKIRMTVEEHRAPLAVPTRAVLVVEGTT
jgi:hypothetical protein